MTTTRPTHTLQPTTRSIFLQGMRDGIPIAMGYYAVAFSLGIIAGNAGISMLMGFLGSWFTRASAGEYGVYSLVAINAAYIEVVGISLIANLRYLLMSAALTQKFAAGTSLFKRILMACCVTDEVFGISIAYPGHLPLAYPLGATLMSGTMWAAGTASGIYAGDVLPQNIVAALSVALYGMFLAIIIPPAKHDRAVGVAVIASFALSGVCAVLPYVSQWSSGIRIIVLTIIISVLAAILKPIEGNEEDCNPRTINNEEERKNGN